MASKRQSNLSIKLSGQIGQTEWFNRRHKPGCRYTWLQAFQERKTEATHHCQTLLPGNRARIDTVPTRRYTPDPAAFRPAEGAVRGGAQPGVHLDGPWKVLEGPGKYMRLVRKNAAGNRWQNFHRARSVPRRLCLALTTSSSHPNLPPPPRNHRQHMHTYIMAMYIRNH